MSISSVIEEYDNIQKFLIKNILSFGVVFLISSKVNDLMSSFVDTILSPLITKLLINGGIENLNDYNITIFGAKINIGKFISEFIKFIALMLIIFYFLKYTIGTYDIKINNGLLEL
jgi:large-conductance mechanosensitive channel